MRNESFPSNLTPSAALVLDYLIRYQQQKRAPSSKEDVTRTLGGTYPLFRYLFPSSRFLDAPIEELQRAGVFDDQVILTPKKNEWVRHSAQEYIRLQDAEIFERIEFSKIWEVVEGASDDENAKWLIERIEFRNFGDLRQAVSLSRLHADALLEIGSGHTRVKEKLISSLAERVGLTPQKTNAPQHASGLPFGLYEAADLVPNSDFRGAIALLNGNSDGERQLKAADRFAETFRAHTVVFILLGSNSELLERELKVLVAQRRAILLADGELKRIGISANAKETMRECIFSQLPPSMVSPFKSRGPVTGDGFFGRRAELNRIAKTPNTVLLGSRKIGKTSLLQALRVEVNLSGRRDTIAVFVEAGMNRRLDWFQRNLMQAIIDESERANLAIPWIPDGEDFFAELEATLRKSGKKYLFLIDEVDNLLGNPKVALFEEFVRSIANEGYARFVLSGYIRLRRQTENLGSFLYNLFTPVILGPLNRRDAADLVRIQMNRIQVGFESDQVVEQILDLGTTFAAYVQRMCELLLQRLDEPMRTRCITSADVHAVYESREFSEEIVKAVTLNAEEELGALGRLILFWAAGQDQDQFTVHELLDAIFGLKFSDALVSLSYLTETYLLAESQGKYSFYTSHLKVKLREGVGGEGALARLIKEYRAR
jgi:hypothetical protein